MHVQLAATEYSHSNKRKLLIRLFPASGHNCVPIGVLEFVSIKYAAVIPIPGKVEPGKSVTTPSMDTPGFVDAFVASTPITSIDDISNTESGDPQVEACAPKVKFDLKIRK